MNWTKEAIAELRRLWDAGVPTAEIGRRLDCSKNAVVGKSHRLKLNPRPNPSNFSGKRARDPAVLENVKRLALRGMGERSIGKAIGISHGTIGVIRRELGLSVAAPVKAIPPLPAYQPEAPRVFIPAPAQVVIAFPKPVSSRQCEWLEGDSPKHFVRCNERSERGSWCAHHAAVVFVKRSDVA